MHQVREWELHSLLFYFELYSYNALTFHTMVSVYEFMVSILYFHPDFQP
jgi:hypothetical protein